MESIPPTETIVQCRHQIHVPNTGIPQDALWRLLETEIAASQRLEDRHLPVSAFKRRGDESISSSGTYPTADRSGHFSHERGLRASFPRANSRSSFWHSANASTATLRASTPRSTNPLSWPSSRLRALVGKSMREDISPKVGQIVP